MTVIQEISDALTRINATPFAHVDLSTFTDDEFDTAADPDRVRIAQQTGPGLFHTLWGESTLLSISAEMSALTQTAALTFPDETVVNIGDLPWPTGFAIVADSPIRGCCDDAHCWTDHKHPCPYMAWWTDAGEIYACWYGILDDGSLVASAAFTMMDGFRVGAERPGNATNKFTLMPDGTRRGEVPAHRTEYPEQLAMQDLVFMFTVTFWTLIQQRIIDVTLAPATRSDRRQWERRQGRPLPEIQIISLRQPRHITDTNTDGDGEQRHIDWAHRWIVGGHWRNQWHPKSRTHKPTWIAPHIKGPADKPIVTSAYRWKR